MALVKMDDVWQETGQIHMVSNAVEETSHNKHWQGRGERKEMGVLYIDLYTYTASLLTSQNDYHNFLCRHTCSFPVNSVVKSHTV